VAVLPFTNLSSDPEDAFFAAGIHDTVLHELAKIRALNVIGRTSVLQYANGQTPISEIAETLNVETVLEATVQYADDQVRITAQLIDPDTGAHLWSGNYDRPFKDIFAIQSEIATHIAMALEAELLPAERKSIENAPTDSPEAYALYLQGLALPNWLLATDDDVRAALSYLDQAIELDPEFALAYARRAMRLRQLSIPEYARREEQFELLEKALELDPGLGIAHAAIAALHANESRWEEARRACESAVEASPKNSIVLADCARTYAILDQPEQTSALVSRALELDPDNAEMHQSAGESLLAVPNTEEAIAVLQRAVQLEPRAALTRIQLGRVLPAEGRQTEALEQLRIAEGLLAGDEIAGWAFIAYGYGLLNRDDDAARAFAVWEERQLRLRGSPGCQFFAYLGIRDYPKALTCINENIQDETYGLGQRFIKVNAFNDPILDQPEFVEVRSRLGFRE